MKEFEISENQLTILLAIYQVKVIEQGKLGEMIALERSSISRSIRPLITKGWVNRSEDYRPIIELTQAGKEFVKTLIPVWEEIMDELSEMLSDESFAMISSLETQFK